MICEGMICVDEDGILLQKKTIFEGPSSLYGHTQTGLLPLFALDCVLYYDRYCDACCFITMLYF